MPWARASSLHRHLHCPASCSLPQFDRGAWRPGHLANSWQPPVPEQLPAREQTGLEVEKQQGWGLSADWGTEMHAAKAGIGTSGQHVALMAPHRDKLWPSRLGRHEVGVSYNCETRIVDYLADDADIVDKWKSSRPDSCVVGTVDFWGGLPTGEPWIDDLKTGWQPPDTATEQTTFYLMCRHIVANRKWPSGRISVTHWSARAWAAGQQDAPTRKWQQLSAFALGEFEYDVIAAYKRAIEPVPTMVPGIQCEYCPSALVCPKGRE